MIIEKTRVINAIQPDRIGEMVRSAKKSTPKKPKITDFFKRIPSPFKTTVASGSGDVAVASAIMTSDEPLPGPSTISSGEKNTSIDPPTNAAKLIISDDLDLQFDSSVDSDLGSAATVNIAQVSSPTLKKAEVSEGSSSKFGVEMAFDNLQRFSRPIFGDSLPPDVGFVFGNRYFIEGIIPVNNVRYSQAVESVDSLRVSASRIVRKMLIPDYHIVNQTFKGRGHNGDPSVADAICQRLKWSKESTTLEKIKQAIIGNEEFL